MPRFEIPKTFFFSSFFPRTFSIFPPLPGTDKNTFVDAFLLTCTHTHFQKLPKRKRDLSPVAGRIKGRQNENILKAKNARGTWSFPPVCNLSSLPTMPSQQWWKVVCLGWRSGRPLCKVQSQARGKVAYGKKRPENTFLQGCFSRRGKERRIKGGMPQKCFREKRYFNMYVQVNSLAANRGVLLKFVSFVKLLMWNIKVMEFFK